MLYVVKCWYDAGDVVRVLHLLIWLLVLFIVVKVGEVVVGVVFLVFVVGSLMAIVNCKCCCNCW